ncbi:MAG: prolyl oligopeptidase family serine peptidase [Verrucomicrobia bacterium]|nr:prolyl oligopeptidase family serine peptidase [Verrucomicrobiota bacterium]
MNARAPGSLPIAATSVMPAGAGHSVLLCLGLTIGLCTGCGRVVQHPISEETFERIAGEITAAQPLFRFLTPDHSGKHLAYIRAVDEGRRLFVLNLQTLEVTRIKTTNQVSQIFGWSPDDRYLAFAQVAPGLLDVAREKGEFVNETWLTILDCESGRFDRITTNMAVVEGSFTWLAPNTYFFASKPIGKNYAEKFVGDWERRTRTKVYNYISDFVLTSESTAAFVQKGNIQTCQLDAPKYPPIQPVSRFATNEFDAIKWLRYSRPTGQYLFCARRTNSHWRHVFQFEPAGGELTQLNDEDTYNGQWLEQGKGFAYVGNRDNHFYLALRPGDPSRHTNLFVNGAVVNYMVAPDGNRVYATASQGVEPQGLWEYDLNRGELRCVVRGTDTPYAAARLVEPVEMKIESFDGVEVPVFVFFPAKSEPTPAMRPAGGAGGKKYPAVIYLPPSSWQFQKAFDAQAQLLANLGFFFVAINYRGCDGYGKSYAELKDLHGVMEDVLAVCRELAAALPIDERNVFLSSNSDGGALAFRLVAAHPEMWRGAVLDHPPGWSASPEWRGRRIPPLFFISGDQDRFLPSLRRFETWARTNDLEVISLVHTNCGHMNWKMAELREQHTRAGRFFLDRLR